MDFVCLMKGMPLRKVPSFRSSGELVQSPHLACGTDPILLLGRVGNGKPLQDIHILLPAFTPTENLYLHKLGDGGPLCLSGIEAAQDLYCARFISRAVLQKTN